MRDESKGIERGKTRGENGECLSVSQSQEDHLALKTILLLISACTAKLAFHHLRDIGIRSIEGDES